jgi:hypothetical protein
MGARPIGLAGLRVPGLYEKIRTRELKLALSPDPRLLLGDLPPHERAVLEAQTYAPTVLGQTDELLARKPVRLPRWLLGGRVTCPQAKGWPPFEDRQHDWFTLDASDVLTPA